MNRKKLTATFVKTIVAALTASGILALGTQTATAVQAIVVTIPFAFSAGNQQYPVGTYQFTVLSGWSLSMRNVKTEGKGSLWQPPRKTDEIHPTPASSFATPQGTRTLKQFTCRIQT